jgi:hypothetical protein
VEGKPRWGLVSRGEPEDLAVKPALQFFRFLRDVQIVIDADGEMAVRTLRY